METLRLNPNKRYSYADYLTWFDDKRRELIDGFINLMTPAPAMKHQKISMYLAGTIFQYLKGKKCKIFHAPFDVRLPKNGEKNDDMIYDVVQPDIIIVCDSEKLDDKGCIGAPDFIVEILSPSTRKKDLKIKYNLYEKSDVREYWIVYPNEKVIYQYILNEQNKYEQKGIFVEDDKISPHIFHDLEIDVNDIFKD